MPDNPSAHTLEAVLRQLATGRARVKAPEGVDVGDGFVETLGLAELLGDGGTLVVGATFRAAVGRSPADHVLSGGDGIGVYGLQHFDPDLPASGSEDLARMPRPDGAVWTGPEATWPSGEAVEALSSVESARGRAATMAAFDRWTELSPDRVAAIVERSTLRAIEVHTSDGVDRDLAEALAPISVGWALLVRALEDLKVITSEESKWWWGHHVVPVLRSGRFALWHPPAPKPAPARERRTGWRAPAAVLDGARLHFGDGEVVDIEPPRHLGDLAELAARHRLGWGDASKRIPDPGQIWLTAQSVKELGLPLAQPAKAKALETAPARALALEAGWELGVASSFWRVWRRDGSRASAMAVAMPWMTHLPLIDVDGLPRPAGELGSGDVIAPSELAHRLERFAALCGLSYRVDYAATGVDLMRALGPDVPWTLHSSEVSPAAIGNTEGDYYWSRQPAGDEGAWVHCYDRGGSYLAACSSVWLGVGEPTHTEGPGRFLAGGRETPGYWRITPPEWPEWMRPNPLDGCQQRRNDPHVWVTTPTLRRLVKEDLSIEVHESWTWEERSRPLRPFYERLRDVRAELLNDDTAAGRALLATVKGLYSRGVGRLARREARPGDLYWRPDWRHHVIAQSRVGIDHLVGQVFEASERTPVAIGNDALWIASDVEDPVEAWPGDPAKVGRGLGAYRPVGSLRWGEFAPFLGRSAFPAREAAEALLGGDADGQAQ